MIHVLFKPSPDAKPVDVLIDERKHSVQAVLQRAAERVFPGPFDPAEEAGSEARYQEVMRARQVSHGTVRKRAA